MRALVRLALQCSGQVFPKVPRHTSHKRGSTGGDSDLGRAGKERKVGEPGRVARQHLAAARMQESSVDEANRNPG
eukprot:1424106-Prorocentrum_lima.AAC.1